MASAAPLKEIDEKFLQCSICLEQLNEPTQLPCLHRYCRDCLKKIVRKDANKVQCPTCRQKHDLPEDGVDGLKTDFITKNLVEFIQLQNSAKKEPLRVCIGCIKKVEAKAYCFKCCDFLCQGCHDYHVNSMIVKDHHRHILSLDEAAARNLTIEQLALMKVAPRCQQHPDKVSELCCVTCGNMPICVPCTYGKHRGHELQEVSSLAEAAREKLRDTVDGLMEYKEDVNKTQERMRNAAGMLARSGNEEQKRLRDEYSREESKITSEISDSNIRLERRKKEIDEVGKKKASSRKQGLETEIKKAREHYEEGFEADRQEIESELKNIHGENKQEVASLQGKLGVMNKNSQELQKSLQNQEKTHAEKIKEMSDNFDDVVKRFDNVTERAFSIFAAKNDWTDAQCIPDVCAAIDPLLAEVKKEYPELEILNSVTVKCLSSVVDSRVYITEEEEFVVDIEWAKTDGSHIDGITGSNGNIVITGVDIGAVATTTFIKVINTRGKQIRQNVFDLNHCYQSHCDLLSQFKIVVASWPFDIRICDVRNGKYIETDIRDITGTNWGISYAAVNPRNNHIIVGYCHSKMMYVFDDQLKLIHSKIFPKIIETPIDICVHEGKLLVCDAKTYRAFALTMKGSECEMAYEFRRPNIDGEGWTPHIVCTDKNGFVYMIWAASISNQSRWIIAQYSRDGSQLLQTRSVNKNEYISCMSTVETDRGEKLLLVTRTTGQLMTYGLY